MNTDKKTKIRKAFLHVNNDGEIVPEDIVNPFIHVDNEACQTNDLLEVDTDTAADESVTLDAFSPMRALTDFQKINAPLVALSTRRNDETTSIKVQKLEDDFLASHHVLFVRGVLYVYTTYYKRIDKEILRVLVQSFCRGALGENLTPSVVDGVVKLILSDSRILNDKLRFNNDYIAFKNGLYSLSQGCLVEPSPSIFCVHYLNANYSPYLFGINSTSRFSNFLDYASGGNPILAKRILQLIAVLLSPKKPKKIFALYGTGDSGKSVVIALVRRFLCPEDCSEFSIERLDGRFALETADGSNLMYCPDVTAGKIGDNACAILKKLVSLEDKVEYEGKYKRKKVMDTSRLKVVIATNTQLSTVSYDVGIESRLTYVVMPYSVPKERQIEGLSELLFEESADEIASVCVGKILPELMRCGYEFVGEAETSALMSDVVESLTPEETVDNFISQRISFASCDNFVTTQRLHEEYLAFTQGMCRMTNLKQFSEVFRIACSDRAKKERKTIGGHRLNVFSGISLKEDNYEHNYNPRDADYQGSRQSDRHKRIRSA